MSSETDRLTGRNAHRGTGKLQWWVRYLAIVLRMSFSGTPYTLDGGGEEGVTRRTQSNPVLVGVITEQKVCYTRAVYSIYAFSKPHVNHDSRAD